VAYSGSFDRRTWDQLSRRSGRQLRVMNYSFDVAAGATFVVVVHEVNVGRERTGYTLNVDGAVPPAALTRRNTPAARRSPFPRPSFLPARSGRRIRRRPSRRPAASPLHVRRLGARGRHDGDAHRHRRDDRRHAGGAVLRNRDRDRHRCQRLPDERRLRALHPLSAAVPLVITAPSSVGAGSPNRTASVPPRAAARSRGRSGTARLPPDRGRTRSGSPRARPAHP